MKKRVIALLVSAIMIIGSSVVAYAGPVQPVDPVPEPEICLRVIEFYENK